MTHAMPRDEYKDDRLVGLFHREKRDVDSINVEAIEYLQAGVVFDFLC